MTAPALTSPMLDVLGVLLHASTEDRELSGWQIIRSIRRPGPVVYRVLDRLEDAGWIGARWEESNGDEKAPRRRLYRLTGEAARSPEVNALSIPGPPPRRQRIRPSFGPAAS